MRIQKREPPCYANTSPGASIMADRGFTNKDLLLAIGADLCGKKPLASKDEVVKGTLMTSLWIYIERTV